MVDIHCHILPEVDDGAGSMPEALAMARMAVECGVTDLAATSHYRAQWDNLARLEELKQAFWDVREALAQEQIPLRLHPGAEILCSWDTVELAADGLLPGLGGTDYVLCEFRFDAECAYMDDILSGIAKAGYRPVVAHPERYAAIQRDPRRVRHWFGREYVIQMDKGSVLGSLGSRAQDAAGWLLEAGCVHMVASDAHSARRRTTRLSGLQAYLRERYPREYVRLLLEDNPGRLLRGEPMLPVESF